MDTFCLLSGGGGVGASSFGDDTETECVGEAGVKGTSLLPVPS